MSIAFLLPEEKSILSCIMFVSQAARRSVRNILNRGLSSVVYKNSTRSLEQRDRSLELERTFMIMWYNCPIL
jgi:hypothetical protein